ncbi:MAG: peptide-methionine (R)-S-oxide reductase, partial [Lewinella sp.]
MRYLSILFVLVLLSTTACNSQSKVQTSTATTEVATTVKAQTPNYKYDPPAVDGEVVPIDKPESYWKEMLSPEAYNV